MTQLGRSLSGFTQVESVENSNWQSVIIFGIGDQKSQLLGSIGAMDCPRCHNTSDWPIHRVRSYFSLFFIPVIPYSTKFMLSCPVCRETREISAEEKDRYLSSTMGHSTS